MPFTISRIYRKRSAALLIIGLATGIAACAQVDDQSEAPPELLEQSDALANQFQMQLQSALSTALSEAGPVEAIGVCQSAAPAIGQSLSVESGASVRRVARKNRNPGNERSDEIEALYARLEASPLDGAAPRAVHAAIDGKLVYMRAIPMQEQPCSTCHGTDLDPAVEAAILAAYPQDRATGFEPGELRGAFLIEHTLAD